MMAKPVALDPVGVIRSKRDGKALTSEQIVTSIRSYLDGSFAEEQMAALLMAIVWRGMTPPELATWTEAMIDSGARIDLSSIRRPTVDKHSTGGVGDKISLILVPLVAACGAAVPQTSGRGLGHTGGTLDKMETIHHWRPDLSVADQVLQLEQVGAMITAASAEVAPADRRLYALRDITATVESIPLIASSIMSKKIAEGTASLLLDVKVGKGAFMADEVAAHDLAATMMRLGEAHGVRTAALLTQMDEPLGATVGNAMEVAEALDVLAGGGPDDVRGLVLDEARVMLELVGIEDDPVAKLDGGQAMDCFRQMVAAQHGDPDAPLPQGEQLSVVVAERAGWIDHLDARGIGVAAWRLGAGRARPGEAVSAVAGVRILARSGQRVRAGEPVLVLEGDNPKLVDGALAELVDAVHIADAPPRARHLVLERLGC